LGISKSDTFPAAITLDEFNASSFQGAAKRGFVCERYWNFSINDLHTTDSCHADF